MRLDHLLSKEHLTLRSPEPRSKAHVLRWELMGGTFDMTSGPIGSLEYAACSWKGWLGGADVCTLLGPEGPGMTFGL